MQFVSCANRRLAKTRRVAHLIALAPRGCPVRASQDLDRARHLKGLCMRGLCCEIVSAHFMSGHGLAVC